MTQQESFARGNTILYRIRVLIRLYRDLAERQAQIQQCFLVKGARPEIQDSILAP